MKDKQTLIITVLSVVFIVGAIMFTAINISKMRDYELNYLKVTATVTGLKTEHVNTTDKNKRTSYRLYYTYTLNDTVHEAKDSSVYYKNSLEPFYKMVGKQIEVYVSTKNLGEVTRVNFADVYSLISLTLAFFGIVLYAVAISILTAKSHNAFIKRMLLVWLPIFLFCIVTVFLLWLGLPTCGFGAVFKRIGGAIGYTVLAAAAVIAAGIDLLVQKRKKQKAVTAYN